jgi:hypothetical protein
MTLRSYMLRLIWLCVAPLVLLAAYLAVDNVRTAQKQRDLQAANLAKNAVHTIDQGLEARIGGLKILAQSPNADRAENLRKFYREARNFHRTFGSHVVVADPAMHMLLNTRVPLGTALPMLPRPAGHAAAPTALATGEPAVGDMFPGPIAHEPLLAIAVPGLRDGKVAFLVLAVFEARIMAVADVIEAMSSHRPYRPGLGVEAALAEIERGRGSVYDAQAVDAALRLFREKRYQLSP